MLEKSSAVGVDVGVGVFYFADSSQNSWNCVEAKRSQIANIVVFNVPLSECLQMNESRISVPQNSVSIARNNPTFA